MPGVGMPLVILPGLCTIRVLIGLSCECGMTSEASTVSASANTTRSIARNAAALAIASIISKGALLFWQLVLARLLTPAEYGIYGTIGGMLVIAAVIPEFGMGIIVIRDVAQRREQAGQYLTSTFTMQPLLALVAYMLLLGAGYAFGYGEEILLLLPLAGLTMFADLLGNMVHNQLLAHEQMVIPSIIGVVHILLLIMMVFVALAGGGGLVGLYGATIAASLLRAIFYWLTLFRYKVRLKWPINRVLLRMLMLNGAPVMASTFMSLAYQHVDKLVMTATIGPESTALLMAAFILVSGVVELLNTTVLVAVFPMMSQQYGAGDFEAFNFLIDKLSFLTLVLTVPIGVAISVLASDVIALLFSPEYTRTTDILQILIWFGVVMMYGNVFAQMLLIQNRQIRLFIIRALGLLLNVVLLLVLLPRMGAPGAGVSSVVAQLLILVLLLRQWELAGDYLRRVGPRIGRMILVSLLMAAVMSGIKLLAVDVTGPVRLLWVLGALVAGTLVYAVLAWFGGVIAPEDRRFIRQVLVSIPGGTIIERWWA
ncbi:oligosaccharide flippase family protein [Chloroflexota bacterium]